MSRIEKLSVSGVRSFSPNHKEAIQFNTPLTLIVGYNGSGKTTIIECLKYATTGELPPNSKGGAFVHDPKLAGEKEVLAQVKLSFRSANGVPHVVTRSMQLTVQRTKRTFKTIEGSLVRTAHGERSQVSLRNVKLDELVPHTLGVSPAILDSVIFCHQDESLWPLSEPSALKKKFDEIFQAAKWTKAIDALKMIRKKHGEELAKLKILEEQDRITKDKADRCEKASMRLQSDIETSREKGEKMTREMEAAQAQAREKHEQANSFLRIVNDIKHKLDQLEYRRGLVAELKETLEELPDSDASLEQSLEHYEEEMGRLAQEMEGNKVARSGYEKDLQRIRADLSVKLAEQGRHQSDKDKYARQVQVRLDMIHEAATEHEIRGFDGDLTEAKARSFGERIQKLLADKKRDLERLQAHNAKEVDEATSKITTLEGKKAARTQDRVFAKQRTGAIEKRSTVLQNDMTRLNVDESSKALLDHQFKDVGDRLERAHTEFEGAGWDTQIHTENDNLRQLEGEHDRLNQELVECTRLATERAQLDYRKKELSDKRVKLDALTGTWKDELTKVLGGGWEPDTVESHYQDAVEERSKAVADVRKRRDQAQTAHQQANIKLKNANETLKCRVADAQACGKRVETALSEMQESDSPDIEDFPDELSSVESDLATLKNELSLFDALVDYYNKCKTYLDDKSRCLLCDHAFDSKEAQARKRLEKKIEKHLDPKKKVEVQKDLGEAAARLKRLTAVRADYDAHKRLGDQIPKLKQDVKAVESEFETTERQLEEHDAAVAAEEEAQKRLESTSKAVMTMSQASRDIREASSQIDRVMSQQQSSSSSHANSRSADEIQEVQARCGEQIRTLKSRLSKLTQDRQRAKDQLSSLELERSELNNKVSHVARDLERKRDMQSQMQSLRDDAAGQREVMHKADRELEAIETEMAEARSLRDEVLRRCRAKEQAVVEGRDAVSKTASELKMAENDIQDYIDRGGPTNLAANQRAVQGLEQTLATIESHMSDLQHRTSSLKTDLDNGDRKKRNINDNINYRRNLRTLDTLSSEIGELESRRAHEDYDRLEQEARMLDNKATRLLAGRGTIIGSMKQQDEELQRLLEEWEQDYRDAGQRYRESHIKVEATKAAIEDLGQYASALDKAIMQYHSLKMEEINRVAGELWQATYQGTDIDTILIRSDAEVTATRRTYNYRLCMVKQDTEMDMRGRCSAGQKVLASIIVRLALAESFGVNCGLVALDEPTTNLDSDNIRSLAESLHHIIQTRQSQKNLQLIVITHDEEFLRHMRCSDFCDGFYRVRRDDHQNSVIEKESITKVM